MDYTSQMTNSQYGVSFQQSIHSGQTYGGIVSGGAHQGQSPDVLEAFHRNLRQYNYGSSQDYYAMSGPNGAQYYSHGYMGQQVYYQDVYGNPIAYPGYHQGGFGNQIYAGHPGMDPALPPAVDQDRIGNYGHPQVNAGTPGLGTAGNNIPPQHPEAGRG